MYSFTYQIHRVCAPLKLLYPQLPGFLDTPREGHTWWGRSIRANDLQPDESPSIVRTNVWTVGQKPNSTQHIWKILLLWAALPQFILLSTANPVEFSPVLSSVILPSCSLLLPELPWLSHWMILSKRIIASSCLCSELVYQISDSQLDFLLL